jgi:hypothetical protein
MQAINTLYKGYRFRSRLEARWAVFLETLGAHWSYEAEGYNLSGIWYLPDFFVGDWNCWIEIKGQDPSTVEAEKCRRLALQSKKKVLLLAGEPWAEESEPHYNITLFDPIDSERSSSGGWQFGQGRRCSEEIWLVNENDMSAFTLKSIPHERDEKFPLIGTWANAIMAALEAARQARFEHGESPGSYL